MRKGLCSCKAPSTYNDAWACKHLAKAGGSISGKGALEIVLGVEAGEIGRAHV